MDVSAVTTGTGPPALAVIESGTPPPAPSEGSQPALSPQSQTPTQPQGQPVATPASAPSQHRPGLAPAVAKLFGGGAQAGSLNVSYRVIKDIDEIVTVFTDPVTGAEIAQVPSEAMIGLAQFFDQERGATLDKNA